MYKYKSAIKIKKRKLYESRAIKLYIEKNRPRPQRKNKLTPE